MSTKAVLSIESNLENESFKGHNASLAKEWYEEYELRTSCNIGLRILETCRFCNWAFGESGDFQRTNAYIDLNARAKNSTSSGGRSTLR
ncbi:hypothetical protein V6N11_054747 [Hibiscus sabdariffa]|uniref:Uncharacterized protein n=1 Tax=Hibiscus sabdariffa TaxID=183260 RepID=A0ABR2S5P3_9ROSI